MGTVNVTAAVAPVVLVAAAAGVVTQLTEQLMVAVLLYAVPYTIKLFAVLSPTVELNVTTSCPPPGIVVPDGNVQVMISLFVVAGAAGGVTRLVTPERGEPLIVTAPVVT